MGAVDERAHALGFLRDVETRCSTTVQPWRWGEVLFNEHLPKVYDLNFLRLMGTPDVSASELIAEAHRIQGPARLVHRMIVVEDQDLGAALSSGFQAEGWTITKLVVMVRHRPLDRTSPDGLAVEIDLEAMRQAREHGFRSGGEVTDEEAIAQLTDHADLMALAANARFFGVMVDGHCVSSAQLYSDGETAQIESVQTLPEHRNKGYARAVVAKALDEALRARHDFVFMLADDTDWPKALYGRMGFDAVGYVYDFRCTLPEGAASGW
jgi:GNAT superfamily N-acetyltransferase